MRIVFTANYSPWSAYSGGAVRAADGLARALARRGHEVAFVYTKPPRERVEVPDGLPYALHWAVFPDPWSRRQAPLRALAAASVLHKVRSLLAAGGADVVHSHGEEGGLLHRLRPAHTFGLVAHAHYPWYPAPLLTGKPLSPLQKAWLVLRESKYVMQGRALRHSDLCLAPSGYSKAMVEQAYGIDGARVQVLPNGVSEEFFHVERRAGAADGPIVFFGRLDRTKGADVLLEALALLGDAAPACLLIGKGPEVGPLARQADALGIGGRVTFQDWSTPAELASILSQACMAVLPSREESFGLAIAEALATGAPVISTRRGPIPELIADGASGLLVPPDDPRSLAGAIRRVRDDAALALRLGEEGRGRMAAEYTWDAAARHAEALYERLPGRRE